MGGRQEADKFEADKRFSSASDTSSPQS